MRVSLVLQGQLRGRNIVTAAPERDLLLAMLSGGLRLIEALKSTVVALVEAPMLVHRDIVAAELSRDVVISHDSASQH